LLFLTSLFLYSRGKITVSSYFIRCYNSLLPITKSRGEGGRRMLSLRFTGIFKNSAPSAPMVYREYRYSPTFQH